MNTFIKPKLSFWQLWNMSFGFFGIQFGFALQNANTSRIFSTLGASPDELPLFWLAAPITGLLVQPIIGYLSDNTWHPVWGRRRPFFFIGALLAASNASASAVWPMITPKTMIRARPVIRERAVPVATTKLDRPRPGMCIHRRSSGRNEEATKR
jgi:MFS family permease